MSETALKWAASHSGHIKFSVRRACLMRREPSEREGCLGRLRTRSRTTAMLIAERESLLATHVQHQIRADVSTHPALAQRLMARGSDA